MRNQLRRGLPLATFFIWSAAVLAGLGLLSGYGSTPGNDGQPETRWPAASRIQRVEDRANLVMAVHPRCPCTRASLAELERLLAQSQGRVEAHVLFLSPAKMPAGWERSGLWTTASQIPGAHAIRDPEGAEAARFGLETSGHVLLYDANGVLRFSGGITAARGHEGDNAGLDAVRSVLFRDAVPAAAHPVFGCPMFARTETPRREERP